MQRDAEGRGTSHHAGSRAMKRRMIVEPQVHERYQRATKPADLAGFR